MEKNNLEKKIRDWAVSLGFTLPDGSTPPTDYFALLTATPHRRQLWEAVIESIQTRQKLEHIRKQILVAKLQDENKFAKYNSKQVTDRIELWRKHKTLENEIKEKRNAVNKLEKTIMSKASDLLFETKLERQFEELEEKSLVLKLFSKQEKKIMDALERSFLNKTGVLNSKDNLGKLYNKENPECLINELLSTEECKYPLSETHHCELLNKFEEFHKFGISEEFLWERVIKLKKTWLGKFSALLKELNSYEKSILCEKEAQMEGKADLSITKLKQKMTEKSLQVIMNSIEEKLLDSKIEKLEEKLLKGYAQDGTLDDVLSFLYETDEPYEQKENALKNLRNYLNVIGFKSYIGFLQGKLKQLEEMTVQTRRNDELNDFKGRDVQLTTKAFESVADEINSLMLEEKEIKKQIICHHDKLQVLVRLLKEEIERRSESRTVQIAAHKLKLSFEKHIEILLETPLQAFRTVKSRSSTVLFECESATHCLINYGGEFKQFFSAMLIPPLGDLQNIFSEVCKRKKIINEVKKFISERERLVAHQRKIQNEVNLINYDSQLCQKNFKESDSLLWNVFFKTDKLLGETDFIEKILKNWIEQPYRLMIKETPKGKSLKEYEQQFRKGKTDNLAYKET